MSQPLTNPTLPAVPGKKPKRTYQKRMIRPGEITPENTRAAFMPKLPTSGQDLMAVWELPQDAWNMTKLKVCRGKYGTQQVELIAETTIEDYSMERIARDFGPGEYTLILNPGPGRMWGEKKCLIPVSPDYARESGFSNYPATRQEMMPSMSQARSLGETSRALQQQAAFTPEVLAQLIEGVAKQTAEAMRATMPPPAPAEKQMSMMEQWDFFQRLEDRAFSRAQERLGITPPPTGESATPDWAAVALEAIPALTEVAKAIFSKPIEMPQQTIHHNPSPQPVPQSSGAVAVTIPLSEDEKKEFAGAVAMLRPFVGTILAGMKANPDMGTLAGELSNFVPRGLHREVILMAEMVNARGKEVLALIDPRLSTHEGESLILNIGAILGASE